MAARLDSLKVQLQNHSALLRQMETGPAAPLDHLVFELRAAASQISESLSVMTATLQQMQASQPPTPCTPELRVGPVYMNDNRIFLQTRHGLLLVCDSRDLQITPYLMTHRVWEPALTIVFERLLKPGRHVLEIGAHIGYFTTLACALVGHQGRVDAFEPHPRSYELLCANLRLNHMAYVARTHRQAVASSSGVATLFAFTENAASSTLSSLPGPLLEEFGEQPTAVNAPTVSLDEHYQGVLDRFDFVKIDAEGAESLILRGGREFLTSAIKRECVVAFEYNPPASQGLGLKPSSAVEQLAAIGFSLVQLTPDGSLAPLDRMPLDYGCNAQILARRGNWPASIHQL
ncbi:MAG: FkbM family methyltransferase [Acidobacteriota bacterium]|nr:FkbM family methyltransferase [Acidobacteriota bacterium]